MSEARDSNGLWQGNAPAAQSQQAAGAAGDGTALDLSIADPPSIDVDQRAETELDLESVYLLARFLMGAAFLGGDELFRRLRYFQQEIDAEPWSVGGDGTLDQESNTALLRYLAIGLFARGQRTVTNGIERGFRAALGTTSWAFNRADRMTDNWLTGPLRRSLAAGVRGWGKGAAQVIKEGKREEQISRQLAGQTINEIIDEVVDYVAENPDMQEAIRHLVAQQGVGFANVVADNSRSVTVAADYLAERLVRRILGRTPRAQLPLSPLAGQPQTMYSPTVPKPEEVADGR